MAASKKTQKICKKLKALVNRGNKMIKEGLVKPCSHVWEDQQHYRGYAHGDRRCKKCGATDNNYKIYP